MRKDALTELDEYMKDPKTESKRSPRIEMGPAKGIAITTKEPIVFNAGATIKIYNPQDLVRFGITVSREHVADKWGEDAAINYSRGMIARNARQAAMRA